jgi:hypothetical protein
VRCTSRLVIATGSHLFQYGPAGWPDWALILLYWGLPCIVGGSRIYGIKETLVNSTFLLRITSGCVITGLKVDDEVYVVIFHHCGIYH